MTESQMPPVTSAASIEPAAPVAVTHRNKFFNGRINRMSYFLGPLILGAFAFGISLLINGVFLVTSLVESSELSQFSVFLSFITSLIAFVYNISFSVRRAHDIGKKWTYLLWCLVPLVNIYIAVVLVFRRGDKEENKYGLPPKSGIQMEELFGFK